MSNISIGFWEPPAHSKYGDDLISNLAARSAVPHLHPTISLGKKKERPCGLLSAPFLSGISEKLRSRLSLLEEGTCGDTGDGWQVGLSTANCTQIKHIWLRMILPFQSFRASSYEDENTRQGIYVRILYNHEDSTRKIMCFVLYFCFCVKGWQLKTTGSPVEEHPKDHKVLLYGRKMSL